VLDDLEPEGRSRDLDLERGVLRADLRDLLFAHDGVRKAEKRQRTVDKALRVDKRRDSFEIEELKRSRWGALASLSDEKLERIGRLDAESTFSTGC